MAWKIALREVQRLVVEYVDSFGSNLNYFALDQSIKELNCIYIKSCSHEWVRLNNFLAPKGRTKTLTMSRRSRDLGKGK